MLDLQVDWIVASFSDVLRESLSLPKKIATSRKVPTEVQIARSENRTSEPVSELLAQIHASMRSR